MGRIAPEDKIASATTAIRAILKLDILEVHRYKLLSQMIWMITEAGGKYTLRYRSEGAIKEPGEKLHHEHVMPRKWLIERLKSEPSDLDAILADAVGCLVTVPEHRLLEREAKGLVGWERYKKAGIKVMDTKTQRWIT